MYNHPINRTLLSLLAVVLVLNGWSQQSISLGQSQAYPSLICTSPYLSWGSGSGTATNFNSLTDSIHIQIFWGDGTYLNVDSALIENGTTDYFQFGDSHTYSSPGIYYPYVIATAPNGMADSQYIDTIITSNSCINFTGFVYLDLNGNCQLDSGDVPIQNRLVQTFSSSGVLISFGYTNASGYYSYPIPFGLNNLEHRTDSTAFYSVNCPSSGYYTTNSSSSQSLDFGLSCTGTLDDQWVLDFIWKIGVPGDTAFISVQGGIRSCSTGTITDTVELELSPLVSYAGPRSGPTPDQIIGNKVIWYYSTTPSSSWYPDFQASVFVATNTSTSVFDTACFVVRTSAIEGELNESNNERERCVMVGGAYDPNDKTVWPAGTGTEGFISNDERLTYRIRFQNTGTAEAKNIYILDTLSDNLDLSSMRIESVSHQMTTTLYDSNKIRFDFPSIYLLDSNTNEPESHGFIIYSIDLIDSLEPGTEIQNRAHIFFDYNVPITTPTTRNTIAFPSTLTVQLETRDVTCLDNNNGSVVSHVSGGTPPYIYDWSTGDTTSAIDQLMAGAYSLTVTDDIGSMIDQSVIINENRHIDPPLIGSIQGDSVAEVYTTKTYSIDSIPKAEYLWSAEGGYIYQPNYHLTTVEWSQSLDNWVAVEVFDSNGCANQDTLDVNILAGFGEIHNSGIIIHPNPAKNELSLLRPEALRDILRLYDVSGRVVKVFRISSLEERIDLSDLSSGVYSLHLTLGNWRATFIKQ